MEENQRRERMPKVRFTFVPKKIRFTGDVIRYSQFSSVLPYISEHIPFYRKNTLLRNGCPVFYTHSSLYPIACYSNLNKF